MTGYATIDGVQPKAIDKFLDDKDNRTVHGRAPKFGMMYRGFAIEPKRDFGKDGVYQYGMYTKEGFVVTDGGMCNVMPAATWFRTVESAMRAIDDLIDSQVMARVGSGEHPFWALNRFRRESEERAPELALLLQALYSTLDWSKVNTETEELLPRVQALLNQIDDNCDTRDTVHDFASGEKTRVGPRVTGRFGLGARG